MNDVIKYQDAKKSIRSTWQFVYSLCDLQNLSQRIFLKIAEHEARKGTSKGHVREVV